MKYRKKAFILTLLTAIYSVLWGTFKIVVGSIEQTRNLIYIFSGIFSFLLFISKILFLVNYVKPFSNKDTKNIIKSLYLVTILLCTTEIVVLSTLINNIESSSADQHKLINMIMGIVSLVEFILSIKNIIIGFTLSDIHLVNLRVVGFAYSINAIYTLFVASTYMFEFKQRYLTNYIVGVCLNSISIIISIVFYILMCKKLKINGDK